MRAGLGAAVTGLLLSGALAAPASAGGAGPAGLQSSTGERVAATSPREGLSHGFSSSTGSAGAAAGSESIIGSDQRTRVSPTTSFPARATVLILRNGRLHCTGWMVSKDTLVTAGHCVHTGGSGGSWYSGLTFRPGSDGGTAPYGTCSPRRTYAYNGWLNNKDWRYDGGIVKLNCTVGNTVGWYGMWWQTASLTGLSDTVRGYPGDKPSTQWLANDRIRVTETERMYYQNDTVGGQSGSPVYQYRSGQSYCNGYCSMGIHAYGTGGSGPAASNNSGTRLTQAKYNSIVSIINAA